MRIYISLGCFLFGSAKGWKGDDDLSFLSPGESS